MRGYEWLWLVGWIIPAAIPIAIAYIRKTTNRTAVLLVALLTSWTCIGWVAAVIMSVVGKPESRPESTDAATV